MHELPVISKILKVVLKHAEGSCAKRVVAVHLQVGELSDLQDKWMQKYFDHLAKETVAAGARLEIERTPVLMKCSDCETTYEANIREDISLTCPECTSIKATMVSGRGYMVKNLEVI